MSNRPKAADWKKHAAILNAGIRGWNALQELPELMTNEIDWMADFKLGFCSESDMPEWTSQGWVPLRAEHFDVDEFNSAIGLRFGLTNTDGIVRFKENILMIMPKDFRKLLTDKRNEKFEQYYKKISSDQAYAIPEDPNAAEILKHYATAKHEEKLIVPDSDVAAGTVKRGPGRPRK